MLKASQLILACFVSLGAGDDDPGKKSGPPFAGRPGENAVAAKPATRAWTVVEGEYSYTFVFTPGIPDPNQVTEIIVNAGKNAKTPDPKYGSRIPLLDARLVLEVSGPSGKRIGRYLAHAMPLAPGRYGIHVTPSENGIHELRLSGSYKGKALAASSKLPVGVWPLPTELEGDGDTAHMHGARRPIRRPLGAKP